MPRWFALPFTSFLAAWAMGCTPSIGDKCSLSTDCSIRGDRLCDTSQPAGYCTIFNCRGNLCPDEAACVLFNAAVQGCGYDDRQASRTGRTFCMAQCHSDSDCRTSDGYVCADPRQVPWSAVILDDDQTQKVCIVSPDVGRGALSSQPDAAVCQASAPVSSGVDAAVDAVAPDAGAVDASDAGPDGASDADAGAQDAGADGPPDAPGGG
jgi:hypothetical protein